MNMMTIKCMACLHNPYWTVESREVSAKFKILLGMGLVPVSTRCC